MARAVERVDGGGWQVARLTLHLLRPPRGEWIGMRSRSIYGQLGAGLAESALFDQHGRIGRSVQSLLIAPA